MAVPAALAGVAARMQRSLAAADAASAAATSTTVAELKATRDAALPPWRCSACGRRFLNERRRSAHYLTHGRDPLRCPGAGCGSRTFTTGAEVRAHVQATHAAQKLFRCETCGAPFSCCCEVHAHSKQHSALPACPECDEELPNARAYADHVDAHMGLVDLGRAVSLAGALVDVSAILRGQELRPAPGAQETLLEAPDHGGSAGAKRPAAQEPPGASRNAPRVAATQGDQGTASNQVRVIVTPGPGTSTSSLRRALLKSSTS